MVVSLLSSEEAKNIPVNELLDRLGTSDKGLSSSEAKSRLEKFGYNEIAEKKTNPILKFLTYFWGPIPWMIEATVIISALINHWDDFFIIMSLLMLNAVVGFWQEHKADNAIALLKEKLAINAKVLRDNKWVEIEAREIVLGDIIRIRLGDIIPADIKLLHGSYLSSDESALTGESLPVEKHVEDIAYSGSIIRQGEMDGLVIATGMNTFFGKTAKLVEEAKTESHFQKAVEKIGNFLIIFAVFLVIIVFIVAVSRNENIIQTLQFTLILIVAAIPAALPAILSITLAIGATALAKREVIVSKLVSIEEMAGMDILCSDKTGTITKNELTLAEVESFKGFKNNDVLLYATLASREEDQDPIDNAIINKFNSLGDFSKKIKDYKILEFTPFDPISKRTESKVEDSNGQSIKISKGAPQMILSLGNEADDFRKQVEERVDNLASKGYRTLGVAITNENEEWQFIGLIPLFDPPREDSAATIKSAESMGVDVKMVTGDHVAIAKEIASHVNLGTNIQQVSTFIDKPDSEAQRIIEEADGFAQVFPEHKYRIVELLQKEGHIVGMTGDGVNDAPALKKADVGLAVAGATDAAKSAADIVITKPGLSVIIDAIKESRKIFQRMNNYSIYRISETLRVLVFITLSILAFNIYPVDAIMIVLIALFNDAPIMAIAYDRVKYSEEPEKWKMRLVLSMSVFLGMIGVCFTFFLLYIAKTVLFNNPFYNLNPLSLMNPNEYPNINEQMLQSFIFLKLAVAGHLTIFMARTTGPFWSIKPAGVLFWSAVVTKIIATLVVVYGFYVFPIGWGMAVIIWGYAFTEFIITDMAKVLFYKYLKSR